MIAQPSLAKPTVTGDIWRPPFLRRVAKTAQWYRVKNSRARATVIGANSAIVGSPRQGFSECSPGLLIATPDVHAFGQTAHPD
jgi:hypothetical protein